jgi:alkylhydroperoxidase family enzyme
LERAVRPRIGAVEGRFDAEIHALRVAVVDGRGELDASVRSALFDGQDAPPEAAPFVDKVRRHAYKITDGDVDALLASGWSEEQVFELTVATALGEGGRRLEAALRAMGGG